MAKQTTKKAAPKSTSKTVKTIKKTTSKSKIDPDFNPTRTSLAVAALAAVSITLLGVMVTYS